MEQFPQYTFKQQVEHAIFDAKPTDVDVWVKTIQNPNSGHQNLIEAFSVFSNFCDKLNVKPWIFFRSLIGYLKLKTIIPWEQGMYVGVSTEDYHTLLKQQTEYKNDTWEFVMYTDQTCDFYKGYPGETFCFRNKQNKMFVVICEYKEMGDNLVPQLPEGKEITDYDMYPKNEIFPLQRVHYMGFGSWIPKNPNFVLQKYSRKIDLQWYDSVPFILTKLFNPDYTELLCQPCTKEIPEVKSFTEGMEKYGKLGFCFVIRNLQGIDLKLEMFEKFKLLGWGSKGEIRTELDAKEIVELWEKDQLRINFVDSSAPNVTTVQNTDLGKYIDDKDLMIILSNNHTYTPFHIDAVDKYNDARQGVVQGGGGWMYLHKGKKLWQTLHPKFINNIYTKGSNRLNDLSVHELLYKDQHIMWGQLEVAEINAGDLLYFPPGQIHRVWTYEKSYGLGGYFDFPGNEANKEVALKYLREAGVDVEKFPGLWF